MASDSDINLKEGRIGGYLVVWGSPVQRDLEGEYFTPSTLFTMPLGCPVVYQDSGGEETRVGYISAVKGDDNGVWVDLLLEKDGTQAALVQRIIDHMQTIDYPVTSSGAFDRNEAGNITAFRSWHVNLNRQPDNDRARIMPWQMDASKIREAAGPVSMQNLKIIIHALLAKRDDTDAI